MTDQTIEEADDRINRARSFLIEAFVSIGKENKLKSLKEAREDIERAIKLLGQ